MTANAEEVLSKRIAESLRPFFSKLRVEYTVAQDKTVVVFFNRDDGEASSRIRLYDLAVGRDGDHPFCARMDVIRCLSEAMFITTVLCLARLSRADSVTEISTEE